MDATKETSVKLEGSGLLAAALTSQGDKHRGDGDGDGALAALKKAEKLEPKSSRIA